MSLSTFKPKRILSIAILPVAAAILLLGLVDDPEPALAVPAPQEDEQTSSQASSQTDSGFRGSSSCRECHEDFYELWAPSHHGLAMQPYTDEFARLELTPDAAEIEIGKFRYQAVVEPGKGWVVERGAGGENQFKIVHVLGGKNVYYFLTEMERGRLQTLPLAYDVNDDRWFDTAASGVRHFPGQAEDDEPVDWRDAVYTFNTACYRCHVSQLTTNYDLETDSYDTVWEEPGINCETCHGPGERHIRAFADAPEGQPPEDTMIIRGGSEFTAEQNNDSCSTCHARMRPLSGSFMPGDRFFDHFDLITLEHEDFYPDGRDLGENYTYTLWRMNPCSKAGKMDCLHCHTSSGRFRQKDDPNQACMPCHAERVNNAPAHTRHEADSEGNLCIKCHMPMTGFARMRRSDHSMLPPTPAATLAFESPNACNLCHTEEGAAWADELVREWHERDYQAPVLRRAALIAAARKGDWTKLPEILDYLKDENREEIYACSLIRLMMSCRDERVGPAFLTALQDPSPLVRGAAADALRMTPSMEAGKALLSGTADDYRLVRIACASTLSSYPAQAIMSFADEEGIAAFRKATGELLESLSARQDQWTSHYNLGNYFMETGNIRGALESFHTALRLEPRAVIALVNASLAHARAGDMAEAEDLLEKALELDPSSAAAHFNAGLLKAEQQDFAAAEKHLRAAIDSDPNLHEAAHNLAIILARDRIHEAVGWCRRAYELDPSVDYGYTLAFYLNQCGDGGEAAKVLEKVIGDWPDYADSYLLLGDIYKNRGEFDAAEAVFRRGLANERMAARDRMRIKYELEALKDS